MDFRVIIPARYASTRLPGKVLMDIEGKPMIQHVYERAMQSGADSVVIAADDDRIAKAAESFGAPVCMTKTSHQSGTERLSEAVAQLNYEDHEIVICVQGDVPLIPPECIRAIAEDLAERDNVKVSSLCDYIENVEDIFDPNIVKVVLNRRNFALYFSRSPIPYDIASFASDKSKVVLKNYHRHLGLYGYRVAFLNEYINWSACPYEELESLEQLRILWNGGRIHMRLWEKKLPPGVDTNDDLQKVQNYLKNGK